jgi:DNA-binding transcriptional LysR family regulator
VIDNESMELRQLEIFRILARELNFTRAATRAHCVQSNVTVQIRSMERELGVALFDRLGKQVRLTPQGQRLLPYAEKILHLLSEAASVTVGEHVPTGPFVIGSPESVLTYRLPPVLHSFRQIYPGVDLAFRASGTTELIPQLEQGEIDLGLVIDETFQHNHLEVEILCQESLKLLVRPDHPLASVKRCDASMLKEQTLLLTDVGCAYRSKLERVLARKNVTPKAIMEFTGVETIKQCAALGMGVACLPGIVAASEIESSKLTALAWSGAELNMQTLVVWHKDKWMSPAMKALLALLRNQLKPNAA